MSLTINLDPVEEAHLRDHAAQKGVSPESLVVDFLRPKLASLSEKQSERSARIVDENGVFHMDRWQAALKRLEEISQGLPVLPPEALTREALYQDHD